MLNCLWSPKYSSLFHEKAGRASHSELEEVPETNYQSTEHAHKEHQEET
jgi:hypothetical protein